MIALATATGLGLLTLPAALRGIGRRLRPSIWSRLCAVALIGGMTVVLGAGLLSSVPMALRAFGLNAAARACEAMFGRILPGGFAAALFVLVLTASAIVLGIWAIAHSRQINVASSIDESLGSHRLRTPGVEVVVIDHPSPRAFSVPATRYRIAQIVVTSGLVAALSPEELDVVVAHEEAHHRFHHHRHLLLATSVEAALWFWPFARASARALRLALERWADDTCASNDERRACLASALVTVATEPDRPLLPAFSSLDGLLERLDAMSEPSAAGIDARWWPAFLLPGASLGAVALYAATRIGNSAFCVLAMAGGCRPH